MPSTLITLSRLAGVIIGGPSLLANAHTMGALYVGYKGSILQISSVVSTVVAICADVVILVSTVAYLIDNNWRFFTQCSATVNILKRAYSINVVYVTVMRFRAINQGKSFPLLEKRSIVYVYMAAYTAFSVATATLQIYAYVSNNWVSAVARVSETFRLYRIFNFVTSFMYVILGVAVDTQFLLMGQSNSLHESKFTKTRAIHNHWLYIGLEVAAFAGFTLHSFSSPHPSAK
ncbi:hypothetical protein DFJ73DRAFT_916184 [Zopfochytrium polystomum]|nr:hypothetical protein DFJ73DRAFT_916184 [Zopfochytrium polystomum]